MSDARTQLNRMNYRIAQLEHTLSGLDIIVARLEGIVAGILKRLPKEP